MNRRFRLSLQLVKVVKLGLCRHRKACGFLNDAHGIQLSKTGVAVSLQDPAEVLEMSAGMLPFAIRRVSAGDIREERGV
jgi:hypothetical protein